MFHRVGTAREGRTSSSEDVPPVIAVLNNVRLAPRGRMGVAWPHNFEIERRFTLNGGQFCADLLQSFTRVRRPCRLGNHNAHKFVHSLEFANNGFDH